VVQAGKTKVLLHKFRPFSKRYLGDQFLTSLAKISKLSTTSGSLLTKYPEVSGDNLQVPEMAMQKFLQFLRDENGASSIEYSMIGAIVSIVILAGALSIGSTTQTRLSTFGSALQ
jgi:Flp pilus assembly pilin Flp